jgi:hypothetical protein
MRSKKQVIREMPFTTAITGLAERLETYESYRNIVVCALLA